jgi:hypothetical protein
VEVRVSFLILKFYWVHPVRFRLADPLPTESQFSVILRRQWTRPKEGGRKLSGVPSRFLNLSNEFEFAGWGSVSYLNLQKEDHDHGQGLVRRVEHSKVLGRFLASAIAGNDILGGVFYTLPAVFVVSGI